MPIVQDLAANVRRFRLQKGFTQAELAGRCELSTVFLQSVESGKRWVGPDTVRALADCLGVSEAELFSDASERTISSIEVMQSLASYLGFEFSDRLLQRCQKADPLAYLPADIRSALEETCCHPLWDWNLFREKVAEFRSSLE